MADLSRVLPGNADGDFFVDDSCIDCDLCRQIAPEVFVQQDGYSVVDAQPGTSSATLQARKALVTCPTGSIGTREKADLTLVVNGYPESIEKNVYFCGFASRHSYGARSYFIVRPEGNVLVDSPRFARSLVRRIEEMGGIETMFLTHQDDVADHEKFQRHFGCKRVIHRDESRRVGAEHFLEGSSAIEMASDLLAIPTPGHTRGHTVLLYREHFLFTGDHLAWSPNYGHLVAFRRHNWYSWPETIRSMARLKDYRFEWVLPGHGRPAHYQAEEMAVRISACVEWMKSVA
jgi:glyoxylase-like metal-dependent hydrolase (beta-lactamase superfamily II)/ferredoxin